MDSRQPVGDGMGQRAFRMAKVEWRARLQVRHIDQCAFGAGPIWDKAGRNSTALTRQQMKYTPLQERGRLGDQVVLVNSALRVGVFDIEVPNLSTRRTL